MENCQCVCRVVLTGVTIQHPLDVRFCPMLQVRVIACRSDLNMLRSSNFATTRIVMDGFCVPWMAYWKADIRIWALWNFFATWVLRGVHSWPLKLIIHSAPLWLCWYVHHCLSLYVWDFFVSTFCVVFAWQCSAAATNSGLWFVFWLFCRFLVSWTHLGLSENTFPKILLVCSYLSLCFIMFSI